jgi:hypothetical protein
MREREAVLLQLHMGDIPSIMTIFGYGVQMRGHLIRIAQLPCPIPER